MEVTMNTDRQPILEKAWLRHAELDEGANRLTKRHIQLRKWVAVLGVVATFLAIFIDRYNEQLPLNIQAVLKVIFIATPLLASMVAAFTSRELGDGRWLSMRSGAEEMKKEIYLYRTVLSKYPERGKWLSNKLASIQRQVYKNSGNTLDTAPYKGPLPPKYFTDDPEMDTGFNDLTPEQYIRCRLQYQLSWHEKKIVQLSNDKRNLTIAILAMGAAGALLAGLGGSFAVWVALTASLTAALTGWEELRNRDKTIANYSKVKLELTIIRDYWHGLSLAEQNDSAFYKLVTATENVMFAQLSEWVRSMQEALSGAEEEDRKLAEEMVQISVTTNAELQRKMLAESQAVFAQASEQLAAVAEDAATTVTGMVTAVSDEAMALNQTMGTAVDTAVAESAAMRQTFDESVAATAVEAAAMRETVTASRDAALDEAAEWRETAEDAADTAVAQSTAARQLAENEVNAWEATSQDALAAAAATADAARETTAAQVEAWQDTAQEVMDTAATESAAMQEAAQTAVDEAAAVAAAAREAAISESAAWGETAQEVVDTAVDESAAMREATQTAVDEAAAVAAAAHEAAISESAAWGETAQEVVDTAVDESAAMREATQTAVDEAAAVAAAAREAAISETAAWGETAQEVVDTAVDESAALGSSVESSVKYAIDFTPVAEQVEEVALEAQKMVEQVVYTAEPDVKYAVQFVTPDAVEIESEQ